MRKIYYFLLAGLAACQSSPPWQVAHLRAGDHVYDSSRLSYQVHDIVSGIGVAMIYAQGQVNTYLEVYSHAIPPHQNDPKQAKVVMKVGEKTIEDIAYRHEGGQRLTLPNQLQEALIQALLQQSPVTILLEGYSATLDPEHFTQQYATLRSQPLKLPFQLPFKL